MNVSLVFLTQRMFVNDESFRQISQNCDYFVLFKNPRNSSEIRSLAQQITPGNLILVDIYIEATKSPFSYLFINLTQECHPHVKYLSNLFNGIQTYIPIEKTFRKIRGNGNFKSIIFGNNISHQPLEVFKPPVNLTMVKETFTHNNPNIQPLNYTQTNIIPMNYKNNPTIQPSNYAQTDISPMNYKQTNFHPINYTQTDTKPIIQSINPTQTDPILDSTKYINTYKPTHNNTQTDPILHSTKYTNT